MGSLLYESPYDIEYRLQARVSRVDKSNPFVAEVLREVMLGHNGSR